MDPMIPGSSNPDHPASGAAPSIRRNPDGTLPEDLAKPPAQAPAQAPQADKPATPPKKDAAKE